MSLAIDHDAYAELEERLWHGEPKCSHCGSPRVYYVNPENGCSRRTRTGSHSPRRLWFCGSCRQQFSVLTGTSLNGSKVPASAIVAAMDALCDEPTISARRLGRAIGVSPGSAHLLKIRLVELGPEAWRP